VFCQNHEDLELLRDRRLVPPERLALLPGSGVDLERFQPGLRIARGVGEPMRLLYAGRMLADKGLNELLEAVGRVNARSVRCELTLCGFADAENISAITAATLKQWAQRPGIRWLGPRDDMPQIYAQADAVVLPSYREGMPRSLLEAAAMGLPVVASDVPGCRQIVTDGLNGLLCEARSADSLHAVLERLLVLSDAERDLMGQAGRARVEAEFDEQRVVDAAFAVLEEVLTS
jgi:glycosyltransferase involved in cell wall biosynthesis